MRQHLLLYLRLKGFAGRALAGDATRLEAAYGLAPHSTKRVRECSGGTRRKLNAAIALSCGRPQVIFHEEPRALMVPNEPGRHPKGPLMTLDSGRCLFRWSSLMSRRLASMSG